MPSINISYAFIVAFIASNYSYLFSGPFHPFQDKELFKTQKLCLIFLFISTIRYNALSLNNIDAELGNVYENIFLTLFYVLQDIVFCPKALQYII